MKIVKAIVMNPPNPLCGEVLCDWHRQCHGGDPKQGVYRSQPAEYNGTWLAPDADKYVPRPYYAVEPVKIPGSVEAAFDAFEAYAREPATKPEIHKARSAQVLAWLMSHLIRAWPFDSYNEELAQIAFQAGTVRLGFQLFTLSLDRKDIKQDVAYSITPNRPTVTYFVSRIVENLQPLEDDASGIDVDDPAESLVVSHLAFSRDTAVADALSLSEDDSQVARPSTWFLTGADSRQGRRTRSRMRRKGRS